MKVKVIKKFRDKETKKIHAVGEELTITKKRFVEIQKVGNFVTEITGDNTADQEAETPAAE